MPGAKEIFRQFFRNRNFRFSSFKTFLFFCRNLIQKFLKPSIHLLLSIIKQKQIREHKQFQISINLFLPDKQSKLSLSEINQVLQLSINGILILILQMEGKRLAQQDQTEDLLSCIRSIKDKFKRNQYFRIVANRPASTSQDLEEKIRSMTVAFEALVQQNKQMNRIQNNYGDILKEKERMIQLKELQVKKYRQQFLDVINKNENLTNYSRQLALEYNNLLNSIRECDETALSRQMSANSKLVSMENQVTFLRKKVLGKQNQKYQKEYVEVNKKDRCKSMKGINRQNSNKKIAPTKSNKKRKSVASILK